MIYSFFLLLGLWYIGQKIDTLCSHLKEIRNSISTIEIILGTEDPEDYIRIKRVLSTQQEETEE